MAYIYIRLTEKITLPAATTSFALDSDRVIVYDGSRKPTDAPDGVYTFALEGEPAEALRAFLNGAITYPVTTNGILDIPKGWSKQKDQAGGGVLADMGVQKPDNLQHDNPKYLMSLPKDERVLATSPAISLDKITERLKQK